METAGYRVASRSAIEPVRQILCGPGSNCHLRFRPVVCSLRLKSGLRTQFSTLEHSNLFKQLIRQRAVPRCSLEEVSVSERELAANSSETIGISNGRMEDALFLDHKIPRSTEDDGEFNWMAQWYPVGVLKHMDKRQPCPVTILGRDLVMWWDQAGGQWQVFADACPHRAAPLSQGRINEEGHLQCSYHGWSFAPSSGACTTIPQAPEDRVEVKNSKRACAKVYLSQHHHGMLWVFMDTTEGAEERAAANPPPHIPCLEDPDFVFDIGMSDISYSYEALIENLLDPAHVPFAHHNIQGNRKSGKPLDFRVEKFGKEGFDGLRGGTGPDQIHKFVAPCLSTMEFRIPPPKAPKGHPLALKVREYIMSKTAGRESPKIVCTVFLCVPTAPGKSRVLFAFPRNFAKLIYHLTPRWWGHQIHMLVLDSDSYLLHLMDHRIEDRGGMANIEKIYYTPTASDAFVVSYRKWLKTFGGGVPDFGLRATDQLPRSEPKRMILDRYTQHVVGCTICSRALKNFKAIEIVLHVLPFLLIGLVAASNAKPLRSLNSASIPLILLAVASSLASRWLSRFIKTHFEFHDYNHALVK